MDGLFGAVGSIVSAEISSQAQRQAQRAQLDAISQQRDYIFRNLDPNVIAPMSQAQDEARAWAQLALQGKIDPALLQARYAGEAGLTTSLADITGGRGPGQVADVATREALAGTPGMEDVKGKLIDAALADVKAGATLPPDLQAQMVQSGLEQSGMATGFARASGIGGTILQQVLGTAGLQLRAQRMQEAQQLSTTAQNLDANRQNILQSLFPRLQQRQMGQLTAAGSVFGTSQAAAPQAGLTGQDTANIWLARVGATNQLTAQQGQALSQGAMAQGQIWGQAAGGLARGLGSVANSGWFSSSTPSDATRAEVSRSISAAGMEGFV